MRTSRRNPTAGRIIMRGTLYFARSCPPCILALVILFTVSVSGERSVITLTNNGYSGILIAIGSDVPEDSTIITNIQDYFTEASKALFTATNRRSYFKDITILVPKTWTMTASPATTESFDRANVIIDKANPIYGDSPYVKQGSTCGKPGERMHLTPKFVSDRTYSETTFGHIGKTVLHEWSHLRWGVYDEYPLDGDENDGQHFYFGTSGSIEATRCNGALGGRPIQGFKGARPGYPCNKDPVTGLYQKECVLYPDFSTKEKTSIMFYHFLQSVTTFCGNSPDSEAIDHNTEAPNRQNRLCEGKSVWEVILEHPDFSNGSNPAVSWDNENFNTTPSFTVVKEVERRYVLILDVSGSMNNNDKLQKMTIAASNFILNIAEEGSSIGIVTFSSSAQIVQSLVRLDSEADRTAVDAKLPTSASGGTCIGCGLLKGIEVLEQAGNASGGILKVISDGKENVVPFIAEVKPTILAKGVIADTILYTTAADDQLTSLAASTGGLSYYSTSDLNNAFIQPAMKRDPTYVQLYSSTFTLNPLSTVVDTVTIDSTVGNNTRFSFSWTGGYSGISLTLTLPNGTNQTASSGSGDTTIIMALPGKAEAGKYRFILENTGSRTSKEITGTVVSRATGGKLDLIHVSSQISASNVDFSDPASLYLIIYADVTRGYAPLVGATVTAIVEASGLGTFTQELKDTGSGADLSAGDGTYSAYFTKFSGNAKYTVMVKVEGGNTTKVKVNTAAKGQGAQAVDVENSGTQFQLTTVDDFSRSSSGGFFTVANQTAGSTVDLFPPSPVRDLRVTAMSYEMRTFTLEWTAMGDDLDQGNASFYDLRMSRNYTALRSDFDSATPVLASQLAEGNLTSPLPAGQREKIIILLKDLKDETTYFFALKVGDESGKNSSASNIVSSSLVEIKPEPSHGNAGLIAGVVVAVILVVIAVVVVLVYFLVIKKKHVKLQESEVPEKSGVDNPAYSKDKVKITNEKKNVNQKGATPATTAYGLNKVEMPTGDGKNKTTFGSKPAKNGGFSSKALNNPVPTAKKTQLPPLKPASTGKSGNLKSKPKK